MKQRWPGWVYDVGEEPDYRFSFANERTFLAWIRTSLALIAAGVALDIVDLSIPALAQQVAALTLVVLAMLTAALSWFRWASAERAMRRAEPLPAFGAGVVLVLVLLVASAIVLVASV